MIIIKEARRMWLVTAQMANRYYFIFLILIESLFNNNAVVWPLAKVELKPNFLTFKILPLKLTNSQPLHPSMNGCNNLSAYVRSAIICLVLMPIHLIDDVFQMLKIIPRYSVYTSTSYTYNTHNPGNIYSIYVPLVIGWPPFHFLIYFFFMWQNHPT